VTQGVRTITSDDATSRCGQHVIDHQGLCVLITSDWVDVNRSDTSTEANQPCSGAPAQLNQLLTSFDLVEWLTERLRHTLQWTVHSCNSTPVTQSLSSGDATRLKGLWPMTRPTSEVFDLRPSPIWSGSFHKKELWELRPYRVCVYRPLILNLQPTEGAEGV